MVQYHMNRVQYIYYRHTQPFQILLHLLVCVIGGSIQKQNCVISPARSISIQLHRQLGDEEFHYLGVGVHLCEASIDISLRVHTEYQAD